MQRECRKARNAYMTRTLFDTFRNGRKKNFCHIKSICKDNYSIPTLHKDGTLYSSDVDKVELLNNYFATIFTQDNGSDPPDPYPKLKSFETTFEEVCTLLNQIDTFKATGPDGIPLKLLKEMAYGLSPSLTLLLMLN